MGAKLRYGLIGCGGCGCGKHLTSYQMFPDDVDIVALCDIVPEKMERAKTKFGLDVPCFTDYRQMLKKAKLDIVSIATPNVHHAPIAIAALRAGIHVHSEKPLCMNAAEAQAIVDAKNASGMKVLVGLNNRYTERARFAKDYVVAGNLGDIYTARCGWRRRRGIPGKGGWFTTKAQSGGGPFIDLGVHYFDLTLFLMGFPDPISVSAATYDPFISRAGVTTPLPAGTDNPGVTGGTCDVEDLMVGFARFAGGATVSFEFSWASNIEKDTLYLELLGTRGGLRLVDDELRVFSEFDGRTMSATPNLWDRAGWGERETRHFIDCLKRDLPVMSPPEEAVKMMRLIDAAYASAASGREVQIAVEAAKPLSTPLP